MAPPPPTSSAPSPRSATEPNRRNGVKRHRRAGLNLEQRHLGRVSEGEGRFDHREEEIMRLAALTVGSLLLAATAVSANAAPLAPNLPGAQQPNLIPVAQGC